MKDDWKAVEYGSEFPLETVVGAPCVDGGGYVYTRSGRDALRLVASFLKNAGTDEVLLPCYCCECMEWPFLDEGLDVHYYRVLEEFRIDLDDVDAMAAKRGRVALLYMHYFGLPSASDVELEEIKKKHSLTIVKDATHDWLDYDFEDKSDLDDYTVLSLRKWAGLPEGGIAFSAKHRLPVVPVVSKDFESRRESAMDLKREYLYGMDARLKPQYLSELRECNELLDSFRETYGMGERSRALCGGVGWQAVKTARRENAKLLAKGLQDMGVTCFYQEGSAPLWMPFVPCCDRDELQASMSERGLYCPYLWPIPRSAEGCSGFVDEFVGRMLCLPCDQRYDAADVGDMLRILSECLKRVVK